MTLLGGVAAWPLATRAQQPTWLRSIGLLLPTAADDPVFQAWVGELLQGLALSDWILGRNMRLDTRWAMTATDIRRYAAELAALAPEVILAHGASTVGPLLQATPHHADRVPVSGDPVAAGLVDSLARPGGNATGFMVFELA
jgi:putative ABC transport system substrate-binding protein